MIGEIEVYQPLPPPKPKTRIRRYDTVASLIDQYLEEKRVRGVLPETLSQWKHTLNRFELFLGERSPTQQLYIEWVNTLFARRLKRSSVGQLSGRVTQFFSWCERMGFIERAYHRGLRGIKPTPSDVPRGTFSFDEFDRLKEAARGTPLEYGFICAFYTGLRLGGVSLLRWENIDLDQNIIRVVEVKMRRYQIQSTIWFEPGGELDVLLRHLKENPIDLWPGPEYVHTLMAVRYMSNPEHLSIMTRRLMDSIGIPKGKTFHTFRRTWISMMTNGGMNPMLAMRTTGHKNQKVFAAYYNPEVTALKEGIAKALKVARENKNTIRMYQEPKQITT